MSNEYAILDFLNTIPDKRIDRCKKHSLASILFVSLVGMLCGANSAHEIVQFGKANINWIKKQVDLPHGIPSHDTISRVFSLIDVNIFHLLHLQRKAFPITTLNRVGEKIVGNQFLR